MAEAGSPSNSTAYTCSGGNCTSDTSALGKAAADAVSNGASLPGYTATTYTGSSLGIGTTNPILSAGGNTANSNLTNPASASDAGVVGSYDNVPAVVVSAQHSSHGGLNNATYYPGQDSGSFQLAGATSYQGLTFGTGASFGRSNRFYPNGRINSGGTGDFSHALADLDNVANINGVYPLGQVPALLPTLAQTVFTAPTPVGYGWEGFTNTTTGYTSFTDLSSGLAFRFNAPQDQIRVEIPSGFALPAGGLYTGPGPEVVHYGP